MPDMRVREIGAAAAAMFAACAVISPCARGQQVTVSEIDRCTTMYQDARRDFRALFVKDGFNGSWTMEAIDTYMGMREWRKIGNPDTSPDSLLTIRSTQIFGHYATASDRDIQVRCAHPTPEMMSALTKIENGFGAHLPLPAIPPPVLPPPANSLVIGSPECKTLFGTVRGQARTLLRNGGYNGPWDKMAFGQYLAQQALDQVGDTGKGSAAAIMDTARTTMQNAKIGAFAVATDQQVTDSCARPNHLLTSSLERFEDAYTGKRKLDPVMPFGP